MTSFRHSSKLIKHHQLQMVQQRLAIKEFSRASKAELTHKQLLIAMCASFASGAVVERCFDENSSTGRIAKKGAGFAFSNVFQSISTLSGFSAVFVYAQLKRFLIDGT